MRKIPRLASLARDDKLIASLARDDKLIASLARDDKLIASLAMTEDVNEIKLDNLGIFW